jgi:hypothetical protein
MDPVKRPEPRSGEFFAPLPLMAVATMLVNDHWLKATFHSELTGKLSDVAVCFFMPLFLSELLGLVFGLRPTLRLCVGAIVTTVLYVGLEVFHPMTRAALRILGAIGPYLGISRRFRMTEDWSDLLCVALVPLAVAYGRFRLKARTRGAKRISYERVARLG